MADQLLTLTVRVNAETGKLEVAGEKLKGIAGDAEKAGKGLSSAGAGLSSIGKAFAGLASTAAVTAFFKSAVQGAEEENQAMRRLKFAVESAGQSFTNAQGQIQAWAQGIQQVTRFTDGQAIEAMGKFVRVTGDTVQAQKASQLAMSLSVATGKDLSTTTEVLTNIINKNERGVSMARKEFGALIAGAENGQQVLDILSAKFGDAALKEEGFSKETAALSNNWNELKDSVGNAVIPVLTTLTGLLNDGVNAVRAVADGLAGYAAIIFTTFEGLGSAIKAVVNRDFGSIADIAKQTWEKIQNITVESGDMIRGEFEKTTQAHAVHAETRVNQTTRRTEAEIEAEKRLEAEKAADLERAYQMAESMEQQILALDQSSLDKKMSLLNAETAAERRKIQTEVQDAKAKENLLTQLDKLHFARVQKLTQAEAATKRAAAFQVVEDSLQTLSIINSMQSGHTKAQVTRARAILALEKTIAIARLWAAEAGKGIAGVAIASAGTALIVAQFAQQSKAIGDAAKIANEGSSFGEFKSTVDIGNGDTVETGNITGSGTRQSGGVGGSGGGGGSFGVSGGGGGGAGTIINIGPTSVSFSTGSVDLSNIDLIARRLGEAVTRGNVEAAQAALAFYRSGQKQEGLAR